MSPWTNPCEHIISADTPWNSRPTCLGDRPAFLSSAVSLTLIPSIHSMQSTFREDHLGKSLGTTTSVRLAKQADNRAAFAASFLKSNSSTIFSLISVRNHLQSVTLSKKCAAPAKNVITARSASSALCNPGYWIFTATLVPSFSFALCTCASDAAAVAFISNSSNTSPISWPSSRSNARRILPKRIGGTLSSSFSSISRYSGGSVVSDAAVCPALT
mmetsp:Transcript_9930/g.27024  ORF Transcript_9930/g.27024 Transcript_9930/m.27024 type:complete len:216 (-) Transcript_9930:814-1461(-)